jgi:hypothetical protein
MVVLSLDFHEKSNQPTQFISFIWPIIERISSDEQYQQAIILYQKTYDFLVRAGFDSTEFTKKVVTLLERDQKSHILDEKYNEAWNIIQMLFQILSDSQMKLEAVKLYQENGQLFAPHRLDLALTMWSQASKIALELDNSREIITNLVSNITNDILPNFKEEQNHPAVFQLSKLLIELNEMIDDNHAAVNTILDVNRYLLAMGDYNSVLEWGERGFKMANDQKDMQLMEDFSSMFFGVGAGLLQDNPDMALQLISTASDQLRAFGEEGMDYYCTKIADIYLNLYTSEAGHELAVSEREHLLKHFKERELKSSEAKFLLTTAEIALKEGNVNEGLSLIYDATDLFQELNDEENLSEVVGLCLKNASKYPIGSAEYNNLSQHATQIQDGGITISDEKTQEAFTDLFDGMLDDMTSLFDPKEKKKRQKRKK